DGDKKADPSFGQAIARPGQEIGRVSNLLVPQNETRALPHHLPAEVEHPPVPADQYLRTAETQHRLGQVLVQLNHCMPNAKVIAQVAVNLAGKRHPAPAKVGRRRQTPPFFEDLFRTVRPDDSNHERRREEAKGEESEQSPVSPQQAGGGPRAVGAAARGAVLEADGSAFRRRPRRRRHCSYAHSTLSASSPWKWNESRYPG